MQSVTEETELQFPNSVKLSKLRIYTIRTLSVIKPLTNDLEQHAIFMGHRFDVHLDFYGMLSDAVQIAKVDQILIAAAKGKPPTMTKRSAEILFITDAS